MLGKVVIVTGGGGVVGAAVASAFAAEGARIALVDKSALPEGRGLRLGGVDLSEPGEAKSAVREVFEKLGRVDVLCNVAGGFRWQTLADGDPEAWQTLFRMNVMSAVCASKAALPFLMRAQAASIVNVSAASALKAAAGMGPYAASKSAVLRFTESLAEETKGTCVRVNAVLPSIVDTPANRRDLPDADFSKWVAPSELADIILFLAGEKAATLNGAVLEVRGGA